MQIRIEEHTLFRANERGATRDEIIETINNGKNINAKLNRLAKAMIFTFNDFRNGKYYHQKKIEAYYIIEQNEIITVTVYVFFGKFEI